MTIKKIEECIKRIVRRRNGHYFLVRDSKRGAPNILVWMPDGVALLIQIRTKNTSKLHQEKWVEIAEQFGQQIHVVHTTEEAKELLSGE